MTERPIIFSAPMVRALIEGRKTETRRIVTPATTEFGALTPGKLTALYWQHADWSKAAPDRGFPVAELGGYTSGYLHVPCHDDGDGKPCRTCQERGWDTTSHRLYPRIQPGDRLWVKETWARTSVAPIVETIDKPWVIFRESDNRTDYGGPWKSPLHLSRRDSRLTLDVTAVRIERLNAIGKDDAIAEGLNEIDGNFTVEHDGTVYGSRDPVAVYRRLWDSLHGAGAWAKNPWVIVITFAVVTANIDAAPEPGP